MCLLQSESLCFVPLCPSDVVFSDIEVFMLKKEDALCLTWLKSERNCVGRDEVVIRVSSSHKSQVQWCYNVSGRFINSAAGSSYKDKSVV